MPISNEEIRDFFDDMKNGTYKCAFCGNEAFMGNNIGGDAANLLIPASPDTESPATGSHPFITITCTNCGDTTFFHLNQFNAWRAKKKARGS